MIPAAVRLLFNGRSSGNCTAMHFPPVVAHAPLAVKHEESDFGSGPPD
jgi:hypothetical protein